ncbi:unnamed protein product [Rhodiola kirilowii]
MITEVAENARFREEASKQEEFRRTRNVLKAETSADPMAEELKQMKEMMQKLIMRQPVQVKPCEFCGATDHKTDACPTVVEEEHGDVNALNGFQNYDNHAPGRQYGQAANRQSWRNDNHAPREPAQQTAPQQTQQYNYYRPPYPSPSHQSSSKSLDDIMKELATTMHRNQAKDDETLAELGKQISNLAQAVSELKSDPGRLLS